MLYIQVFLETCTHLQRTRCPSWSKDTSYMVNYCVVHLEFNGDTNNVTNDWAVGNQLGDLATHASTDGTQRNNADSICQLL